MLESLEMVLGTKLCLIKFFFLYLHHDILNGVSVLYDSTAHQLNNC